MRGLLLCALLWQATGQTPAPPAADAIVLGRILDPTGAPVPAAVVSIQSARASNTPQTRVMTDDDGRYFFDHLEPGLYNLSTTKSGWVPSSYGKKRVDGGGQVIELAEHDRKTGIDITMWKLGALSGVVVDEYGEALVDVEVRAVRRLLVSGARRMVFVGSARTDDRGVYRISGLTPGDYSVFVPATVMSGAVSFGAGNPPEEWLRTMTGEGTAPMSFDFSAGVPARSGRNLVRSVLGVGTAPSPDASWLAVPPSFAGAPGVAGAASFAIGSGQERVGIDMQLRPTMTYPVSGVLQTPSGSPANLVLHLMSAGLEQFPLFDVATATADASGAFTFFGVPPGEYVIRVVRAPLAPGQRLGIATSMARTGVFAMGGGPGSPPPGVAVEPLLHATQKISVGNAPLKDVQVSLRPGPRVSGRADFEGSAPRPEGDQWRGVTVTIEHANGYTSDNPPRSQFAADGTFSTAGVIPGEYYIRATAPAGWHVKSVVWQGHNIIDAPLALASADVTDVVVTYTDRPATVRGNVYVQNDQAAVTAVVLVFPVNQELWTDYGRVSLRMASARVMPDGTFKTTPLIDGDYHMVAIPDDQATEWQDPAVLAKLAKLAKQVVVRVGETSSENLKLERLR